MGEATGGGGSYACGAGLDGVGVGEVVVGVDVWFGEDGAGGEGYRCAAQGDFGGDGAV